MASLLPEKRTSAWVEMAQETGAQPPQISNPTQSSEGTGQSHMLMSGGQSGAAGMKPYGEYQKTLHGRKRPLFQQRNPWMLIA
jgi:hypothetical protein